MSHLKNNIISYHQIMTIPFGLNKSPKSYLEQQELRELLEPKQKEEERQDIRSHINSMGRKIKTTFELLVQILELSQNTTLGASDQHPDSINHVKFRDKPLKVIPFIDDIVLTTEENSDAPRKYRLEKLFRNILNKHSNKVEKFRRF